VSQPERVRIRKEILVLVGQRDGEFPCFGEALQRIDKLSVRSTPPAMTTGLRAALSKPATWARQRRQLKTEARPTAVAPPLRIALKARPPAGRRCTAPACRIERVHRPAQ
jgi:hypothetical protein